MPLTKYINVTIGGEKLVLGNIEEFPLVINRLIEDLENFQKKPTDEAFNVIVPANIKQNQKVANSFHDVNVDDTTPGQELRNHRSGIIEVDGVELLNGKAFLISGSHSDVPEDYEFSFYGGNGDWSIDLKEKTLYEYTKNVNFLYGALNVLASWGYDGRNEQTPYVFAPIRYRGLMDEVKGVDDNVSFSYLRPSLSVYWVIYWVFKSLGYKIQSELFETNFFRRLVMPWTWGSFLTSEGTSLDIHNFKVKSSGERFINNDYDDWLDLYVTNESTDGMFDNNKEYDYLAPNMQWTYKTPDNGLLEAHFEATLAVTGNIVGSHTFFDYYAHWFLNDVEFKVENILSVDGRIFNAEVYNNLVVSANTNVVVGDRVSLKIRLKAHEGKGVTARVNLHTRVDEFKLSFFRQTIGGTINFASYNGFKKFKVLDYLKGVFDLFNISPQTDVRNKIVYLEPMHEYTIDGVVHKGFYNKDFVYWDKKDYSQKHTMSLFSDYEREVLFKYINDGNDGVLKVVQDRHQAILASCKYLFPPRFKQGKKEITNTFFAPAMHFDATQFEGITGIAPQMVCIIPENISNTSRSEADNTFTPKILYYKGVVTGFGGWKFEDTNRTDYPMLFAVNYKPGGENDPSLSYSDENVNGVVVPGLLKKFFCQRLAIMRNGQFYDTYMKLNSKDVAGMHREFKLFDGQFWELAQINNYKPLRSETTKCFLRRWVPIGQEDYDNIFPSQNSLMDGELADTPNDVKYIPLKCLITDIPR